MSDTTNTGASAPAGEQAKASWRFLKGHLREYGILFALIAIMAFFQIATGGILLKPVNLTNLILQNSYIVIMAIGMLLVILNDAGVCYRDASMTCVTNRVLIFRICDLDFTSMRGQLSMFGMTNSICVQGAKCMLQQTARASRRRVTPCLSAK